ncbi:PREDICTED: uncharacterized protein LOC109192614 [Ipomoea nil]|uniref:uncharacterized protein LOC109192614 n=1 Tax=Ipomoea nil TaxID=35883 RepID=UPI000900FC26|nr:PREDICTED: uncharacterized protein LOC109192614 [Ipomoea nil]XP_019198872.1 PREDICTED: uncharacterized protein LOC109192614 [Ipomoea nil]
MGEGECGSSTPPNSKHATTASDIGGGGTAAKFLANLPSRGLFSSTVLSSNPGGMRVYICDHDTSPPEDQLIKTDQMNILIRSLMLKKQKAESGSKDGKSIPTSESSRKRCAERALDGRASAKKAASSSQAASRQEGTKNRMPERDYHSMTVERLRALLKEKGLSPRGKKDELIARLKESLE